MVCSFCLCVFCEIIDVVVIPTRIANEYTCVLALCDAKLKTTRDRKEASETSESVRENPPKECCLLTFTFFFFLPLVPVGVTGDGEGEGDIAVCQQQGGWPGEGTSLEF